MSTKRRPTTPPPSVSVTQILAWADDFHTRTNRWPRRTSGRIVGGLGLTWQTVDGWLWHGRRGLPKNSSLAQLLAEHRGYRHKNLLPRLKVNDILAWADAHRERTGTFPTATSGPIQEAPGETWAAIDLALRRSSRGLRGGYTLAQLLARRRGRPNPKTKADLAVERILAWSEAWHTLYEQWPTTVSGPIGNTGETWLSVDKALRNGTRGLAGKTSLYRLLKDEGKFAGGCTPFKLKRKRRRPGGP